MEHVNRSSSIQSRSHSLASPGARVARSPRAMTHARHAPTRVHPDNQALPPRETCLHDQSCANKTWQLPTTPSIGAQRRRHHDIRRHDGRGCAASRRRRQQRQGIPALRLTGVGMASKGEGSAAAWRVRRSGASAAPLPAALGPFPGQRHLVTSPRQRRVAQRGQGGAARLF